MRGEPVAAAALAEREGHAHAARRNLRDIREPRRTPRESGHAAVGRRAADARDRADSAHRREHLLLDEISEGLAPVIVQMLARVITMLKSRGFTILLVEQNYRFAAPLADRFYVMGHGRIADAFESAHLPAKAATLQALLNI